MSKTTNKNQKHTNKNNKINRLTIHKNEKTIQ